MTPPHGNNFVGEYVQWASSGIQDAVGLKLVCEEGQMNLETPDASIVACVQYSEDLPGDIDRLRGVWLHTTSNMSNSTWD